MRKRLLFIMLAVGTAFASVPAVNVSAAGSSVPMYRMYNYRSGEHFYTKNERERNSLLVAGWDYEGIGWTAPSAGKNVYRLYNPNAGDHHYTTSEKEKNALVRLGWKYEGSAELEGRAGRRRLLHLSERPEWLCDICIYYMVKE